MQEALTLAKWCWFPQSRDCRRDAPDARLVAAGLPVSAIEDRACGMHEFTLTGPSGSNIRVGRNAPDPG
ncbi:MAG: hypothetical protein ABIR32_17165 [Ilumatobacteraceae bacterium]